MKTNPIRRAAYTFCAVCILGMPLGFPLGAFGGFLDSMDDRHSEWASSQSLIDAQMAAAKDAKMLKEAQSFCTATKGESIPIWDADGNYVCKPKGWKK